MKRLIVVLSIIGTIAVAFAATGLNGKMEGDEEIEARIEANVDALLQDLLADLGSSG